MNFGEKVRELRKASGMSQAELAEAVGISLRTLRGWEAEGRYPRYRELYTKLAEAFGCDVNYLMTDEEAFLLSASEEYGARGAAQAKNILSQTEVLFAGGDLSEEDKLAFLTEIQQLYLDSKKRAKKFAPGGRTPKSEDPERR